jgi:hypothetical protein
LALENGFSDAIGSPTSGVTGHADFDVLAFSVADGSLVVMT